MKILRTILMCCVAGWATLVIAQESTDLSGTWVLDTGRSENLGMMSMVKQTLVVTQTAEQVTLDFTNVFFGKESTSTVNLDLGGDAVDNLTGMGDPSKTETSWQDGRLVTVWTTPSAIPGDEVKRIETHSLADDGATLVVTSERANRDTMKMVYGKQ